MIHRRIVVSLGRSVADYFTQHRSLSAVEGSYLRNKSYCVEPEVSAALNHRAFNCPSLECSVASKRVDYQKKLFSIY
jgi:hypothetical protein